jgi:hypothetical protein
MEGTDGTEALISCKTVDVVIGSLLLGVVVGIASYPGIGTERLDRLLYHVQRSPDYLGSWVGFAGYLLAFLSPSFLSGLIVRRMHRSSFVIAALMILSVGLTLEGLVGCGLL